MAATTRWASSYLRRSAVAALALGAACALAPALALGQTFEPVGERVQKRVNGVLGFNHLSSVGAGLELDSGKYDSS